MERYESVELIVRKIVPTLTGDADKDEDSFYTMADKYANHPRYGVICALLAKEYAGLVASHIASEQLCAPARGKSSRQRFPRADSYISSSSPEMEAARMRYEIKHIGLLFAQNKIDWALYMASNLVEQIEKYEEFLLKEKKLRSRFYNELFEEILDPSQPDSETIVQTVDRPIPWVYYLCGSILNHLKRFDEAKIVLERGLKFNPADSDLLFEQIEAVRGMGDLELFEELTRKAFSLAFRARDIARCYRNLGDCCSAKRRFRAAVVCCALGARYETNSETESQIAKIAGGTARNTAPPNEGEIARYAEKYGIPLVPNERVVKLAAAYAKYHAEKNQSEEEKYFTDILENELKTSGPF